MNEVLYESGDGIAVITLNRPDRLNTLNTAMRDGLFDAWRRFEADTSAHVAIFTASGDRAFCAGRDLKEKAQAEMVEVPRDYLPIVGDSVNLSKPVIAAVNGPAYALGFIFVQMCDMCVASSNATFSVNEVKMGRGVAWAVPLASMIPRKVMMELVLTSTPISAHRAYEVGLVNHVVPPEQLMAKAMELARAIVVSAPLSVRTARQVVRVADEYGRSQAMDKAYEVSKVIYESEDALEGIRAYLEKRAPKWRALP